MKILSIFLSALFLVSIPVQANSKKTDPFAADVKAAAAKRKAAEAALAKKKADEDRKIQANLSYLSAYLPTLTAADLKGKSAADLREYYYQAYRVQGMNMADARLKADQIKLDW